MKVNYIRLFVDLLLMGIIPLFMLGMGVNIYTQINELEKNLIQNKQMAKDNLGEYSGEAAMLNYTLEVEFEMQSNQRLNVLAISYVFLSMGEGMILLYVFKNLENGRYLKVE